MAQILTPGGRQTLLRGLRRLAQMKSGGGVLLIAVIQLLIGITLLGLCRRRVLPAAAAAPASRLPPLAGSTSP